MKSIRMILIVSMLLLMGVAVARADVFEDFNTLVKGSYSVPMDTTWHGFLLHNTLCDTQKAFTGPATGQRSLRTNYSANGLANPPYLEYVGPNGTGKHGVATFSFLWRPWAATGAVYYRVMVSVAGSPYDTVGALTGTDTTWHTFTGSLNDARDSIKIKIFNIGTTNATTNRLMLDNYTITDFVLDTTPPSITSVTPLSQTAVDVLFNESVDLATSQTVTNYSVDNGVGNPLTATRDGTNLSLVHLTFNPLVNNSYVLTANGVQDLAGNPCVNAIGNFVVNVVINPGDVVINEIMYDDTASTDAEWVELHNRTTSAIIIGGWILTDAGQYPPTSEGALLIPAGTSIPAMGYLVLSRDVLPGITGYVQCTQYYGSWALTNTGDNLSLFTAQTGGTLMDGSLTQNYPDAAATNAGNSIEKCDENTTWPSDSLSWHVSTNTFATTGRYRHCTPGATNTSCIVDVTPPTLVSAVAIGQFIVTVTFSEDVDLTSSQTVTNYSVDLGVGNPTTAIRQLNPAVVQLTFGAPMVPNNYTLTVNNVQDVAGNPILPNSQTPFTVVPPPAHLIFTEIMPNPNFPGLEDSLGEWFEVYNAGTSSVDLSGWVLTDNAGADTIEGPATINAGQYFVFCSNGDPQSNGGVPVNYAYHYGTSGWGLSLNNGNDSLTVKNGAGAVAAQLVYNLNFGWSEGRSGQLRDLSYNPAIDTNWCRSDTVWEGAYLGDHGTPQHATICAPNLPAGTYTICDIREQDAFGLSILDQQRVITQGVVTYEDSCRRNAYIESGNCAVMIYGDAVRNNMVNLPRHPQVGDLVEVNGYLHGYRGLTEIDSLFGVTPTITFLSGNHSSPAPVTVTAAQVKTTVNDCSPEVYEARHVRIQNLTFQYGGDSVFSAGTSGKNFYAWSGTDTIVFRVVPCDTLVGVTIPAGTVTLNCIVSQFDASSPYCGGYQMVTGNYAPFGAGQCATPVSMSCYRDGVNNQVLLRWQPGVNQQCDCYEIWYANDATTVFPTGYTLLNHVTGTTQYIDNSPMATRRFYVVRAGGSSCP